MSNRICGVHAVFEALSSGQAIERIHISRETHPGKIREILELARKIDIPVRREDRAVIDRLAPGTVHQGIVAITAEAKYASFDVLFKSDNPVIVVLDGVEDPHN